MLDKLYYRFIRPFITRKEEQNQYSGGLWPRLVRETAAAHCSGITGRMIELGCGEGLLLAKLAASNQLAEIHGIDLKDELLALAKERLAGNTGAHLTQGSIMSTPYPDDHFDAALCVNVTINLEGIDAVSQMVREAKRILAPGGTFIFDVRNALSPIIQLQYRLARFYETGITVPLNAYRSSVIERLLAQQGLTIKERLHLGVPKNFLAPAILYICGKQ